jgi:hypothetical protein
VQSLSGKTEAFNKPEEALVLMKIIDAMYKSALTKKPVQIK